MDISDVMSPCPEHIHHKLIQVSAHIDDETVEEMENKLSFAVEEMVALGPGHYQRHPSITKVFKWLVDPKCTPQEFNYFVGPLCNYKFHYSGRFKNLYLGLIAAEALAVKDPILDGHWEQAAWFVVWLNSEYCKEYNYGAVSDNLSHWMIRIMGDPDRCPNPSLRLELMIMFGRMVCINDENGTKALDAVISCCSSLPLDNGEFMRFFLTKVNLHCITSVLDKFVAGGYLLDLDHYIACILRTRVSSIIQDVSSLYGFNPIRYTGRKEETMIRFLTHITIFFALIEYDKFMTLTFYPEQENKIEDVGNMLLVLVTNFNKSCQSPRLIDVTANCVMYVLELVLQVNIALLDERGFVYPKTLHTTHKLLQELCDQTNSCNIVLSPVGQMLQLKYQDRLSNLRQKLGKYLPESNVICNLLYHCNLLE